MSELKPLLLGSMFALLVVSAALAQVTIDVSKIEDVPLFVEHCEAAVAEVDVTRR